MDHFLDETGTGHSGPRSLARGPKPVEIFEVPLGIHAGPVSMVLEDRQLPIPGQICQWRPLQYAGRILVEVPQRIPPEEEIPAVDPGKILVRLLGEADKFIAVKHEFSKP